jgi:hypothetical protein
MPANLDYWRIRPGSLQRLEPGGRKHWFAVSLLMILGPALCFAAELQPETLAA